MLNQLRTEWLVFSMLLLMIAAGCGSLKSDTSPQSAVGGIVTIKPGVTADLNQGLIRATAVGAKPEGMSNQTQANLMARRAAVTIATRDLAEALLALENQAAGKNTAANSNVSTVIKGQRIISEQQLGDGSYQVVMELTIDQELLQRLRVKSGK